MRLVAETPNTGASLDRAKWTFVTRRVRLGSAAGLIPEFSAVRPGDLVLAQVERIGNHRRVQLSDGRYSQLYLGDRLVLACADRFAADQFEGVAALSNEGADLLAGGGVVGHMVSRNAKVARPTQVRVLGRLTGEDGKVLNVEQFALEPVVGARPPIVLGVVGTGMNAGKTSAAAALINGLTRIGKRVAAIKTTGTGAFCDLQAYEAAGADMVLDFTDAGMASTRHQPVVRLEQATDTLLSTAAGCDIAVVELADGVSQVETAELLQRPHYGSHFDGWLLAAPDAMAARGGVTWLTEHGIVPFALSGLMTRAPLAAQEATAALDLPVLSREALADPATGSAILSLITAPVWSAA